MQLSLRRAAKTQIPTTPAGTADGSEGASSSGVGVSACRETVRESRNSAVLGELKAAATESPDASLFFYQTRGVRSRSFASALLPRPQAQRRVNRRSHRVASQQPPAGDRAGQSSGRRRLSRLARISTRPTGRRTANKQFGGSGKHAQQFGLRE